MALVLLYNIPEGEKLRRIRVALLRQGIASRTVTYPEYGHPLGYLAGLDGFAPGEEYHGEDFCAEMLVMSGLPSQQFSALLDTLRASRATVTLKAVVTETNAQWDSLTLYRALQEEHDTMRELLAFRAKTKGKKKK